MFLLRPQILNWSNVNRGSYGTITSHWRQVLALMVFGFIRLINLLIDTATYFFKMDMINRARCVYALSFLFYSRLIPTGINTVVRPYGYSSAVIGFSHVGLSSPL